MMRIALLCVLALPAIVLPQSPSPMLSTQTAISLYKRTVELIESTSAAVPGLPRAAAPISENVRQALHNLEVSPTNAAYTHAFLVNARAYLGLADSIAKPFPFPDTARTQFAELREAVDRIDSHFRAMLTSKETQLRGGDRDNLKRYAEGNDRLTAPSPEQQRVVFLGDSITDGWRLNEYFTGRDFVNRGISGQITGQMLGRMLADVINLKPKAIILLAGTNDIARDVPLKTIENNITMIADLCEFHKIKPLFASVLPVSDYHKAVSPRYENTVQRPPATILELNRWIKDFCARRSYMYVDYFPALVDKDGMLAAELADDGLHPNAQGYRLMAPVALGAIAEVLKPAATEPARKKKKLGVF